MDKDAKRRSEQGQRLAEARKSAGFRSARAAALELGWAESSYRAHEGGTRTIGQDDAEKYATGLRRLGAKITDHYLLFGERASQIPSENENRLEKLEVEPMATGLVAADAEGRAMKVVPGRSDDGDMPLYRFAHAGRGNLILEEIPFETVTRPDYLARVREPYGVMVDGDSMIPEFHAGWIAEVNPNLAPRKDDTCIFRGETVDGGYWAALKVYVREDDTHWHVRQHNPRKSYKLKKTEFQIAHVVVASDRRRR